MKINQDKVAALSYELEVEGAIADKATREQPLEYIHGTGMLIPKFEAEVEGKEPGDKFDFILSAEEGYGEYNPNYKFEIPVESFMADGQIRRDLLEVGRIVPMLNSSGQVIQGKVVSVGEEKVMMDFNHPMAGKTLHFTGEVISVREATTKELEEGLHGEFLPQEDECGCGCGHHHHDGECCHHEEGGCHHEEGGCCHNGEDHECGCGCK